MVQGVRALSEFEPVAHTVEGKNQLLRKLSSAFHIYVYNGIYECAQRHIHTNE